MYEIRILFLASFLVRITIAMIKHRDQSNFVYLVYASTTTVIIKGHQDRKFNREATQRQSWCRSHKGVLLTGCFLWVTQPIFYKIQDYQPRNGPTYNVPGPPSSITNLKNAPQASLKSSFMYAFFQLRLASLLWV